MQAKNEKHSSEKSNTPTEAPLMLTAKNHPAKGEHYRHFNALQQRKLPRQVVSAAPQHPLTIEGILLMQVNGIEQRIYDHHSVLNPSQVFKLQNRERMMPR